MKDLKKKSKTETTSSEYELSSDSLEKKEENIRSHHKVKSKLEFFENLIESKKIRNPNEVVEVVPETKVSQWKQTTNAILYQINNFIHSNFSWLSQTHDDEISQEEYTSTDTDSNPRKSQINKKLKVKKDASKSCSKGSRFKRFHGFKRLNFVVATSSEIDDEKSSEPESTDVVEIVTTDVDESNAKSDPKLMCKKSKLNIKSECQTQLQDELEIQHPKYKPTPKCELCKNKQGKCIDIDPNEECVDSMEIATEKSMQEIGVINLSPDDDDIKCQKFIKFENIAVPKLAAPVPQLAGEQLDLPQCCRESLGKKKLDTGKTLSTYVPIKFSLSKGPPKLSFFRKIKNSVTSVSTFKHPETNPQSPYDQVTETIASSVQSCPKKSQRSPYKIPLVAIKNDDIKLAQEGTGGGGGGKIISKFNKVASKVINVFKKKNPETIECKPDFEKPPLWKPVLDTKKEKPPKRKSKPIKGTINTSRYKKILSSLKAVEKKEKKILNEKRRLKWLKYEVKQCRCGKPMVIPTYVFPLKKPVRKSPFYEVFCKLVKGNVENIKKDKVDRDIEVKETNVRKEMDIKDPEKSILPKVERPVRVPGEPCVNPIPLLLPKIETESLLDESGHFTRKKKETKKKGKRKGKKDKKEKSESVVPAKAEDEDQSQEEYKAPIETKKAAPLPPGPLGDDAFHLRYLYETMWYNKMFEKLIGGYPTDTEKENKKLTEAVEKLHKGSKENCKKQETAEMTEMRFNREIEANIWNCSNSVCLCVGRPKPKSRFFLRNGMPSRTFNAMLFNLCGRSDKKSYKPTIVENFVATSTDPKEVGPDICMPRCAAYYKEKEHFIFKGAKKITWASLAKKKEENKAAAKADEEELEDLAKRKESRARREAELKALKEEKRKKKGLEEDVAETNEFFTTRLSQTEETKDEKLKPDHYSHIYGLPTYQEIRDIDGMEYILDQPSIIEKIVNIPIIQKHLSSMKKIYSSVLGVFDTPKSLRTESTQTVEEEKPVFFARKRMRKMTAMIIEMQAKDAKKAEEKRRVAAIEAKFQRQIEEENRKKEEGIIEEEVTSIPEPDSGTSWVQKDDFAHTRADKCSENKVAFEIGKRVFRTYRTDPSDIISSYPSSVNVKESTHSSLFYVDVGKDLIIKKLGERTTREERKRRYSVRKRNDQKIAIKKQETLKFSPDFSSSVLCGSKFESGSSFEDKQNYSFQSYESQASDNLDNPGTCPAREANANLSNLSEGSTKSYPDSLIDEVFEFGDNQNINRSVTLESVKEFKNDSSTGTFLATCSELVESKNKENKNVEDKNGSINIKDKTRESKKYLEPKQVKPNKITDLVIKGKNTRNARKNTLKQVNSSKIIISNNPSEYNRESKIFKYKKSLKRIVPRKKSSSDTSYSGSEKNDEVDSSSNSSDEDDANDCWSMILSWIKDTKTYGARTNE